MGDSAMEATHRLVFRDSSTHGKGKEPIAQVEALHRRLIAAYQAPHGIKISKIEGLTESIRYNKGQDTLSDDPDHSLQTLDIILPLVDRLLQVGEAYRDLHYNESQHIALDTIRDADLYIFGHHGEVLWLIPCGSRRFIDAIANIRLGCYIILMRIRHDLMQSMIPVVFKKYNDKTIMEKFGQQAFDFIDKARRASPASLSVKWRPPPDLTCRLLLAEAKACRSLGSHPECTPLMTQTRRLELMHRASGAVNWAGALLPEDESCKAELRLLEVWRDSSTAQVGSPTNTN
jgi:hypothetical protein